MARTPTGVRGAAKRALLGAAAGALAGVAVETANDLLPGGLPLADLVDVWPPVLAIAGFVGAAAVTAALALARRRSPR